MRLIFDGVSQEFVTGYVESREWCREATAMGWRFVCLHHGDGYFFRSISMRKFPPRLIRYFSRTLLGNS
jgi:hypothetical protein